MPGFPFTMTKDGHDVEIMNATDERNARANGYDFPTAVEYVEYPKMLVHRKNSEQTRLVHSAEQEAQAVTEGFKAAGKGSAEGFQKMIASPSSSYTPEEFPKWVNGRVVRDAAEAARLA